MYSNDLYHITTVKYSASTLFVPIPSKILFSIINVIETNVLFNISLITKMKPSNSYKIIIDYKLQKTDGESWKQLYNGTLLM